MRYAAGIKLFILGERLRERFDVLPIAREDMLRLREETGQPATLSALVENKVVVLEVLQGHQIVNFGTQPGTVLDLHASAHGNVALAFGPPDHGELPGESAQGRGRRKRSAPRAVFSAPCASENARLGNALRTGCCKV